MSDEPVIVASQHDAVRLIELNRPHRWNAWTGAMHQHYRAALDDAERDPAVRVIVVTGRGKGFCVGADTSALEGHAARGGYDPGIDAATIATPGGDTHPEFDCDFAYHFGLTTPVIAAINGPAAGVGFVLACYADLRFSAPELKMTTAQGKLALPAEYGLSWLLPRIVGVGRALDLLLSSRVIHPDEALQWGLVNQIHPTDALVETTLDYANELASSVSRDALSSAKHQTYIDLHRGVHDSVDDAAQRLSQLMGKPDYERGVRALVERRSPDFQ